MPYLLDLHSVAIEREDYKSVISLLGSQVFHLGQLIHEKTLAQAGLSPTPPNPTISLNRLHHSAYIHKTSYNVLILGFYRIYGHVNHNARASPEMEKGE